VWAITPWFCCSILSHSTASMMCLQVPHVFVMFPVDAASQHGLSFHCDLYTRGPYRFLHHGRLKNRFPFKSGHMEQYWSTLTKRWPSGRSFQSSAGRMIRVQLHQTRVTQSAGRRQERSRLAMYWMSCILASYWHLALMVLGSLCARTNGLLVSMPPSSSSWGRTNASEL